MIYDEHGQHTVKRQLTTLGFLALLLASGTVSSQEIDDETLIVPPKNWYQVEVILFTHDVADSGELAPKDYGLNFPDNLLRLIDVKALAEQEALAEEIKNKRKRTAAEKQQEKEAVEKYGSATSGSSLADILGTALKKKEDK